MGLVVEREEEFGAEELARESDGESRGLWGDTGSGEWGVGKNCGDLGVGVVGKRGLCCMGMMGGRAGELGLVEGSECEGGGARTGLGQRSSQAAEGGRWAFAEER